ncbi:MAG: hypothetical protein M0011_09735 [Elusimicrobia bacterium]|nr:hypothetical protein [Elusimicrobiota bacterium]
MNHGHAPSKTPGAARAALLGALLAFWASPASCVITPTIHYQGYLISKVTNLPVETPQDFKFRIYNSPTGITGQLFSETRCDVKVTKGRYDVEIGSGTAGGVPASIFSENDGLWLEIQVDADGDCAGPFEAMSPRVKLQSSPYAFSSVYATTASVATPVFYADTIGALPYTANGAITISTNLFVEGGISVGSISPGQTLAVAGIVESSTGGFKFPDGSIQTRAAAFTMWDISGINIYTINPGNVGIGESNSAPLARLHVSSAAGATGDLLLVSTGTSQLFKVNGLGQVSGGSYYGDGTTLSGILRSAGDTMTGPLTLAGSTLSVTSPNGLYTPAVKFGPNVTVSSASAAYYGGVFFSSNVYTAGYFYGDGRGLLNVVSSDTSKVLKAGDTMTGQLTISGATLTVTGNAFSVGGSTLTVSGGKVAVGGAPYTHALTVNSGGIYSASSVTAAGAIYASAVNATNGTGTFYNVTATSGTFWGWDVATTYSVDTASGIKVRAGVVDAPYFVGNGSQLTNVTGNDPARLLRTGDTVTGNFTVLGSSLTVTSYGNSSKYALTVGTQTQYNLVVTTTGYVGVHQLDPTAPLDVQERLAITNTLPAGGDANLLMTANNGYNYIRWADPGSLFVNGSAQGVFGYAPGSRNLIYRAMGTDPYNGGSEVFRITSDNNASWNFGIGTDSSPQNQPRERFHVLTSLLVSSSSARAVLFVSTQTGRVSLSTTTQSHTLTVNGDVLAVSSITAQGGFFGDGSGLTNLQTAALPGILDIATVTARAGGLYDAVIFSTAVYVNSRVAIGDLFNPTTELHVKGVARIDNKGGNDVVLQLFPDVAGSSYIRWDEGVATQKGVLGMKSGERDLVYRSYATSLNDGLQVFRIKGSNAADNGSFIIGSALSSFVPNSRFHVLTNMTVSGEGKSPAFYVSTGNASGLYPYVGVSTGAPAEGLHVASSMLVGANRAAASLYVSTATGYTGVGTGSPVEGLHSAGSFLVGADRTIASFYVSTGTGYTGVGTGAPQAKLDVAGLGVFRSSLTVEGGGLSGTQTAFSVIGSTLVVTNYGNVGIGASSPQARLDVNGSAQFGSGTSKSTFTAEGYWQPRSMTTAQLQAASPPAVGAVVFNSSISDLCVSTGTAAGQWALAGSKGVGNCF